MELTATVTDREGNAATAQVAFAVIGSPQTRLPISATKTLWMHYEAGDVYGPPAGASNIGTKVYIDSSTANSGNPAKLAAVQAAIAAGDIAIHLSFGMNLYATTGEIVPGAATPLPAPSPDGQAHRYYSLAQVLAGGMNPVLDQWAAGINAIYKLAPDIVIMADPAIHEPDDNTIALSADWAPELSAQASAYIINYINAQIVGHPVEWCFVVSGFQTGNVTSHAGNTYTAAQLYNLLMGIGTPYDLSQLCTWNCADPYDDGAGQDGTKQYSQYFARIDAGAFGSAAWRAMPKCLAEWGIGQGFTAAQAQAIYANIPSEWKGKIAVAEIFDSPNGAAAGSFHNFALTPITTPFYVAMTNATP